MHFHDSVSARDMFYYAVVSGGTEMGFNVRSTERAVDKKWFPDIKNWIAECSFVLYQVIN